MKSFVEDCLLSPDSSMALYFDQNYIRQILEQDRSRQGTIPSPHLPARIPGALAPGLYAELM